MPWKIVEHDGKFCVAKVTGEELKCYATKAEAAKYLKALYANSPDAKALITDWWDVDKRQLTFEEANYNALAFTAEKGCANCHWFVSPNSCLLVAGDVAPTGVCAQWFDLPKEADEPMQKSWLAKLAEKVKALITPVPEAPPVQGMVFYKSGDRLRWFTVMTNCFIDRQKEIIDSEAHQEFVNWVTQSKQYPELWLWHSGAKSRWGMTDWMDYTGGFVVASGLVDVGKEYIAENLRKEDVAVSHGFIGLITKDNHIVRYRTFEISPLPRDNAANVLTDFNLEANSMAFTKEKRDWLLNVAGIKDEAITEWEKSLEGLGAQLKELGVQWKESVTPDLSGEIVALTTAVKDLSTTLQEVKTAQTQLAAMQDQLKAAVEEQAKSFDARVADVFKAKISALPKGYEASKEEPHDTPPPADVEWFGQLIS